MWCWRKLRTHLSTQNTNDDQSTHLSDENLRKIWINKYLLLRSFMIENLFPQNILRTGYVRIILCSRCGVEGNWEHIYRHRQQTSGGSELELRASGDQRSKSCLSSIPGETDRNDWEKSFITLEGMLLTCHVKKLRKIAK